MRILTLCIHLLMLKDALTQSFTDSVKHDLTKYVTKAMQQWNVPGISIAITQGDTIIYSLNAGYADIAKKIPVTNETIFPVGSMGKSFTAFGIALLQQQNKLYLHDKVSKWLPWIKIKDNELKNGLTIVDILSHRTGMETFAGDLLWTESILDTKTLLQKWGKIEPAFPIRSQFGYSNFGYLIAGEIISAASQTSWQHFTKQNVLDPLNMKNSFVQWNDVKAYPNVATGYTEENGSITTIPNGTGVLQAFGGMYSTSADIAKWLMMHANDGRVKGKELFEKNSVWEVRNPYSIVGNTYFPGGRRLLVNYGLGWETFNYNNKEVVCHGGAYSGFLSMMGFIPEMKAGFVILTNSDSHELTEALRWKFIDALLEIQSKDYSTEILKYVQYQKQEQQEKEKKLDDSASMAIQLPLPIHYYSGTYRNDIYGNILLTADGNDLILTMQHHPAIHASLKYIGNNRFLCTYNHPMFGKTVWPFYIEKGIVKGLGLSVHPFLEFTTYKFDKIK
jgi:CubicO group peptidase (beta-lactamase class C family)